MWYRIAQYLNYTLKAKGRQSVHSPFVFDFIKQVLRDERLFYAFEEIENLRSELLNNDAEIVVTDFGAMGNKNKSSKKISRIVQRSAKSPKLGRLLFHLANHYQPECLLELGTSLGISSLYLSSANANGRLITLEGCENTAAYALSNFEKLKRKNISVYVGEFVNTLTGALEQLKSVDLVFIDGNHRLEPTLEYFEIIFPYSNNNTLFIFDDIYWSQEMTNVWKQLVADKRLTVSIDLFHMGIAFRKSELTKQHFVLRY